MPGRTARKIGCTITKNRQAAAATATTNQGAGLGHLLGMVLGIAIGIAIEIVIEMKAATGSEITTGTAPRRSDRRQSEVSSNEMRARTLSITNPFCKVFTIWFNISKVETILVESVQDLGKGYHIRQVCIRCLVGGN